MEISRIYLVIIWCSLLCSCSADDCIFTDSNGSGLKFNLTTFRGKTITFSSYFTPTSYSNAYTPCTNNAAFNGCSSAQGNSNRLMQQMTSTNNDCYGVSVWDDGVIQPKYNNITKIWSFTYNNGWRSPPNQPPRRITYNWKCNSNVADWNVTSFTFGDNSDCAYIMDIDSSLACVHPDSCSWKSLDGNHQLNLNNIKGNMYSKTSSNDNTLNYMYSPCSDALLCGNISSMAIITNNTDSNKCLTYLSSWDPMVQPRYSKDLKSWKFSYANGQECYGDRTIFEIVWNCDPYAGEVDIITAKQVIRCQYRMIINSKYACD